MKPYLLYISSLVALLVFVLLKTLTNPFRINWNSTSMEYWLELITPQNVVAILCFLFALLGIGFIIWLVHSSKGSADTLGIKVKTSENISYDYVTLFTTLLSLLIFDLSTWREIVLFITVLSFFGAMFVKGNMYYANPCLALFGLHIYRVVFEQNDTIKIPIILLSKREIHCGDTISIRSLSDSVFFDKQLNK